MSLKKFCMIFVVLLPITIAACSWVGLYEAIANFFSSRTINKSPTKPEASISRIHNQAPFIADLHADTLLHIDKNGKDLDRLLNNQDVKGHVDVSRLLKGNVSLQVFSAVSKGSLDILKFKRITGTYKDDFGIHGEPGKQYLRYNFQRDPNIAEYDDPDDPYHSHYESFSLTKELVSVFYRLAKMPCSTWYEDGNWSDRWAETANCSQYDSEKVYINRLIETARKLHRAASNDDRLMLVISQSDLQNLITKRSAGEKIVGAMLSTEGIYFSSDVTTALGKQELISQFNVLYDIGYRMFGLTHFLDNDFAGSSTGMGRATHKMGRELTPEGMFFANLAIKKGAILDLAHASEASFNNLIKLAKNNKVPVVVSHTGLSGLPWAKGDETCSNSRNLTDKQVISVAMTGGVVGIGFDSMFICDNKPISWARAIRHVVDTIDKANILLREAPFTQCESENEVLCDTKLQGINHVALGTDYDGGITAYTDIDDLSQYTQALICNAKTSDMECLERPFTVEEAYKIMGLNSLSVFKRTLPQ